MSGMSGRLYGYRAGPNPLLQLAALLVLGLVLIGAVVMGAVLLALFLGLAAIGAIVFSVRLWWLRRKLRRNPPPHGAARGELIEAEYHVVAEHKVERRQPD